MTDALPLQNLLAGRLNAGVLVYSGLAVSPGPGLQQHIAAEVARLRIAHGQGMPPGFAFSRRLYKAFHVDPTKHRPAAEALWRRLRDRGDFPQVNAAVDLTNLLSLTFQVCYGLYDLAQVELPALITLGKEEDRYEGIRKETLNFSGKIVLKDQRGAFGNPSADSLRTSVHEASRDIMQVLFFHPEDPQQRAVMDATAAAFRTFFTMTASRSFVA